MALFSLHNFKIAGVSACVPSQVRSNHDYEDLTEAERKMLIKTTGIEQCRVAPEGVTTSDLCEQAVESLLPALEWKKSDIDAVILVTQSQDYFLPATAVTLQDRLGLPTTCMALDVSLGCSGYVIGLSLLGGLMASGGIRKALLLAGDISTFSLNRKDKSTYPLFGDAGTATALEFCEGETVHFNSGSDGSGYEAIIIPDGGLRNPLNDESYKEVEVDKGILRSKRNLHLKGLDIMNFSLREVPPSIQQVAEYANVSLEDVDHFVLHQANKLINDSIRKKLKQPPEKFPFSLGTYGNTSSASIPLTMVHALGNSLSNSTSTLLLSGFGVGLSWGSALLRTQEIVCPPIVTYGSN